MMRESYLNVCGCVCTLLIGRDIHLNSIWSYIGLEETNWGRDTDQRSSDLWVLQCGGRGPIGARPECQLRPLGGGE